jgi:hypothetical protein
MDAIPATPWWEREEPAASPSDLHRDARVVIAEMCESLRGRYPSLPALSDVSRRATSARLEVVSELFRLAAISAFREIVEGARARAKENDGDVDASDLPAQGPARSHVLVTADGRDRDKLELMQRAAQDAGFREPGLEGAR